MEMRCSSITVMKNPLKVLIRMCFHPICSFLLIITAIFSTVGGSTSTFQSVRDGQTIVSTTGNFELGFFSPATGSNNRYLGIWYKKISATIVWVANREAPLTDSSGVLQVTDPGILVLLNHNKSIIWSSNTSRSAENPVAQLLDSGNLVVTDGSDTDPENFLWQSFDYPSDTLLPGMKLGWNKVTGFSRHLTSWSSPQDPSLGKYTYELDRRGYGEEILKKDSVMIWRTGPWNGIRFSGTPHLTPNSIFTYNLVFDDHDEEYYIFELLNSSVYSRLILTPDGRVQRYTWIDTTQTWGFLYQTALIDNCDSYAFCGPNGACSIDSSPVCRCLNGFQPKNPKDWDVVDWSNGCVRRTPLNSVNCSGDLFEKYSAVKLPNTEQSWFNRSMNLKECEMVCLKNCSCTAYANLDITDGGSGCLLWFGNLIDIRNLTVNGQDIYIRMAASELGLDHDNTVINAKDSESKKVRIILCGTLLPTGLLIVGIALVFYCRKKQPKKYGKMRSSKKEDSELTSREEDLGLPSKKEDFELPLFDLATVVCATDNFSESSKLGEGGFGSVFKGMLKDGQEIAVKRLSKHSTQGLDEFKNEVTHIVKLQHRNLVRLLGCCIQEDEMMLIYECMPNKSLDFFIFDQRRSFLLDWSKRFDIINGIARGILYLHQDSRLRVIHRDLKAGNILLDSEFNPKISDFGLARSFGGNETKAETNKVVGTYGYMSPEYAIDGFYSIKSDVYSFGVLMLEIISGKRNRGFLHPGHNLNLLGHAWNLHTEGRSIELLATSVGDSINLQEVLRAIHVGVLCVQQNPQDRPSMSAAVLMLSGEGVLPVPQKPGFYNERALTELQVHSSSQACSVNMLTSTLFEPR
ncbi:G-type lectin S-receptor-like serine/threonine-protein kinase At4g27290 isoform X1 [Rosa chinensis]|uniref:G-type lectin S-receptor-like serine/threonine-protein kinase At4g27290 isoform X1 n=1 Tax=Rosa chinensis TaxID=74649 RepID=UPI000D08ABF6|nr:G-type lectin S-receptor-like serine/threonine-protein kinase At4g27290 isoform X1 [Rosa chinensis]XP_040362119.1 G-type lectin S-receptor-like serine/threonine-protein kinase At4g27290 isoform X1 [Rosa chinensis]